MFEGIGEKPKE